MIDIKQIYYDMGNAVNGICDKTFSRNRPKAVDTKLNSFIVVGIPYSIRNNEISDDGRYNDYSTTAQIEVYVRNKTSRGNTNCFDLSTMDEKVSRVLRLFPLSTANITLTRPSIMIQSDDGNGFDVTIITCRLKTK